MMIPLRPSQEPDLEYDIDNLETTLRTQGIQAKCFN